MIGYLIVYGAGAFGLLALIRTIFPARRRLYGVFSVRHGWFGVQTGTSPVTAWLRAAWVCATDPAYRWLFPHYVRRSR